MASDVYLQLDGIKGESGDAKHKDWIEVVAASWGAHQPKSEVVSTAGGHTIGRCEIDEVSISKLVDCTSPKLMELCAAGKTLPKAKLEFMRADGDGGPIKYYEVNLENVLVCHMNQTHAGTGLLLDQIGLKFTKIKWQYTQQKIGGGTAGSTTGGWDLATNKVAP